MNCGTCAAVRSYPSNMWAENVATLAMTTTMGATPTVMLWKYPVSSRILRSSSRISERKHGRDECSAVLP